MLYLSPLPIRKVESIQAGQPRREDAGRGWLSGKGPLGGGPEGTVFNTASFSTCQNLPNELQNKAPNDRIMSNSFEM